MNWLEISNTFHRLVPSGLQFVSFLRVSLNLKPAMDLWVQPKFESDFIQLCAHLGIQTRLGPLIDRKASELAQLDHSFTTTRAAWLENLSESAERHIFLAARTDDLERITRFGWYPLTRNGYLLDKPNSDHSPFGDSLGYPSCCIETFSREGNWNTRNLLRHATMNTEVFLSSCNGLMRHSSSNLVAHLPCRFDCKLTRQQSEKSLEVLDKNYPGMQDYLFNQLAGTFIYFSETRIAKISELDHADTARVDFIKAIPPTSVTDPFFTFLRTGSVVEIAGPVARIYNGDVMEHAALFRNDRHGPEYPMISSFKHA
jgi:hypothetical protein